LLGGFVFAGREAGREEGAGLGGFVLLLACCLEAVEFAVGSVHREFQALLVAAEAVEALVGFFGGEEGGEDPGGGEGVGQVFDAEGAVPGGAVPGGFVLLPSSSRSCRCCQWSSQASFSWSPKVASWRSSLERSCIRAASADWRRRSLQEAETMRSASWSSGCEGVEGGELAVAEGVEEVFVLAGEAQVLAEDAVGGGVLGGPLLALGGAGAGGLLCVTPVGAELAPGNLRCGRGGHGVPVSSAQGGIWVEESYVRPPSPSDESLLWSS
jgi:hypothetical protein